MSRLSVLLSTSLVVAVAGLSHASLVSTDTRTPTMVAPETDTYVDDARSIQRQWFREAREALEEGDQERFESLKARLSGYPLLPYLELRQLQRRLFSTEPEKVVELLDEHSNIPFARTIRQQWLTHLGASGQWDKLREHGQGHLRGERLRCLGLRAEVRGGNTEVLEDGSVADLWLTGRSLPDACDPLLSAWRDHGGLTDQLVWDRMILALQADNIGLARYLRRYLSADERAHAQKLLDVHHQPQRMKRRQDFMEQNDRMVDIVAHGVSRLVSQSPEEAASVWPSYANNHELSEEQRLSIEKTLGLRLAVRYQKEALTHLQRASRWDDDPALHEWQVRIHLRHEDWEGARNTIRKMPDELQSRSRWQYWLARIDEETGNHDHAIARFQGVAQQRDFYGFMAADRIGAPYALNHRASLPETAKLDWLNDTPGIQRAYELFRVGRMADARNEWSTALVGQDADTQVAAAALATAWGWHERSVMGTIAARAWDYLDLRFPLAYQDHFGAASRDSGVDMNWVYALARQESAFMPDARSNRGALGLLQLLPGTAAETARKHGIPFNGNGDLLEPETNIRLGTAHLAELLDVFGGNRILATAAYNAGEHRVRSWLNDEAAQLDSDVWLETMPFYETRQYVKNVMSYTIIYGHRRGDIPARLLTQQELACACIED